MRALKGDFAKPSSLPAVALWSTAGVLVLLGVLVCVKDVDAWRTLQIAMDDVQRLQQKFDLDRARQAANAASAIQPPGYAADARRLIGLSNVDLAGALRSIETAQLQGAKVEEIDIDASTLRIDLVLNVPSADVATAYLQLLNAGESRPAWNLVRVQSQGALQSAFIRGEIR